MPTDTELDWSRNTISSFNQARRDIFKWCTYVAEDPDGASADDKKSCKSWQEAGTVSMGVQFAQLHIAAQAHYLGLLQLLERTSEFNNVYDEMQKLSVLYSKTLRDGFDVFKKHRLESITFYNIKGWHCSIDKYTSFDGGWDNWRKEDSDEDGYAYMQEVHTVATGKMYNHCAVEWVETDHRRLCGPLFHGVERNEVITHCRSDSRRRHGFAHLAVESARQAYVDDVTTQLDEIEAQVDHVKPLPDRCEVMGKKKGVQKSKKKWDCQTYMNIAAQSTNECLSLCCADKKCMAYHFNKQKRCHLKEQSDCILRKEKGSTAGVPFH